MDQRKIRLEQLADDVEHAAFSAIDNEIEYTGDDAARVGAATRRAFLAEVQSL